MTISLVEGARAFGVELTPAQHDAFETYYRELVVWNARVNLTAITARDDVIVKHFLDSLSVVPMLHRLVIARSNLSGATISVAESKVRDEAISESRGDCFAPLAMTMRLIDIGAGAGFPGLPLKIALPHLRLTLLEATGKKVAFLKHIIAQRDLRDAVAIQARAEDLARDAAHCAQYDVAVARAVAHLATLLEYALPFVRQGGVFIAQKGVDVAAETCAAARALELLGGRVREVAPVQLPGLEPRRLIVVEKIAATPDKYPRRAGIPERKPLTD
ncbi:MAG: 16S rRNA (guanine(527)-N(7))-methyltransferase RsmG [Chloroflexota bacterium]